jgi:hypothetical protein
LKGNHGDTGEWLEVVDAFLPEIKHGQAAAARVLAGWPPDPSQECKAVRRPLFLHFDGFIDSTESREVLVDDVSGLAGHPIDALLADGGCGEQDHGSNGDNHHDLEGFEAFLVAVKLAEQVGQFGCHFGFLM